MEAEGALILIIDDEPGLLRLLKLELSSEGYRVATAPDGAEGLRMFGEARPRLVLLDLVMPMMSGLDVLREIKQNSDVPVVLITAQVSEQTRLEAMALGADDFIRKPFSPDRVTSSVKFLLSDEHDGGSPGPVLKAAGGQVEIDMLRGIVLRSGVRVPLSRSEWALLEELARSPGEPRLHQELLSRVWGPEFRHDVGYLQVWIQRLRAKLGDTSDSAQVIGPYLDVGYVLEAEVTN